MRITDHYVREYLWCAFESKFRAMDTIITYDLQVFLGSEVAERLLLDLVYPLVVVVVEIRLCRRSCIIYNYTLN